MRIYVAHSRDFDYINELYKPLRSDPFFNEFELILPHEGEYSNHGRDFYKTIDIFIAECSEISTGLGIELGFAFDDDIDIYCIHKFNKKISSSINAVTSKIYAYHDVNEMLDVIKSIINEKK